MKFLLVIFLSINFAFASETIRAVIVSTLPAPLIINSKVSSDGLVSDYLSALAKELNIELKVDLLSRIRIEKPEEQYDLNCYSSYVWNYHPDDYYWSKPLFIKREIIVGSMPVPKSLKDFSGEPIGTLSGYKYPALDKLFLDKKLLRNDVENEEQNFHKLINKRVPFIVTDELLIDYFKKYHAEASLVIQKDYLVESEFPIQCAIKKGSKLTLAQVNRAIDILNNSGKLEKIFSRYR